ncbi:hydrogenase maturation nickel metallochaperone HypA [Methanococcus aeolicus]|uniref:hydrogenase maturation nickel metallochaperone HypA n=1 Tax=Methanococcus aeolicus TaxID=42879 RepID=UPI0021C9E9AF|nr:hydrogenase maturation nickel metallochaperone HypA [Methanococcus aeolicus]UXM85114.1 hydrogenase maturation nickel metallochaperone HypA [Methanococcus aeolicus]
MHELSYATSIVNAIMEHITNMEQANKVKKVSKINLEIGELTFINFEQLKFAFEVASEGTLCKDAELEAEFLKPHIACNNCGYRGELTANDEFEVKCPECGSLSLKISGGKEFNIKNAILESDE